MQGKYHAITRRWYFDPLLWGIVLLIGLNSGMAHMGRLFSALFPELSRPVYQQDSFWSLTLAHVSLVAISSLIAVVIGVSAGLLVTHRGGREFRSMVETITAVGQTFPPVAVLAVAVPLMGFSPEPAVIALVLYGLLPILQGETARGAGMNPWQILWRAEIPLAAPVILAGVRTSVIINIGTAAIASTVGVKTLGSPIIIGLSGFNTAYVIQGALLVALLAMITDAAFERWVNYLTRWRQVPPSTEG